MTTRQEALDRSALLTFPSRPASRTMPVWFGRTPPPRRKKGSRRRGLLTEGVPTVAALLEPTYTKPIPEGAQLVTREGKRFAKFKDRRGNPLHGSPTTTDHLLMTEHTMPKPKITL